MNDGEKLLRHCTEVWGNGDLEVARELYHPEIVDLNPSPGQRPGADGVIDIVRFFHSVMSDIAVDVHDIIPLGEGRWLDRWTMRGTHTGNIMGFSPTGRRVEFSGCDIVTFRDGLMVSQWHVEETLQLLLQVGLTLPGGM